MILPPLQRLGLAGLIFASMALAGCDSAEERAEGHYESAVELLDAGDVDRAVVELRNVFKLAPRHREARLAYARLLKSQGRIDQAFGQYLRVSEENPSDAEIRAELAELAIALQDWEAAERHGRKALELAPDSARNLAIGAVLDYQAALAGEDPGARRAAAREAADLRAAAENTLILDQIVIDNLMRDGDAAGALAEIDAVLARDDSVERLHGMRLRLLQSLQDRDGVQGQLERMVALFPGNDDYAAALIRFYTATGQLDEAEAFIRDRIAQTEGEARDVQRALLVSFLNQTEGAEAALAALDEILEAGGDPLAFRPLRAGLLYDAGDPEAAIAELQDVIAEAGDAPRVGDVRVALARMLMATGDEAGARDQVDQVLAADGSHVAATKMRAAWMIGDDKADKAILALRAALDQAPDDPQIMTLMADAHLRNGDRAIAGEMLALAVEASGRDVAESLRYARFLQADGKLPAAEQVLVEALRAAPGDRELLVALGQLHVARQDWSRAEQVERTLRRLEDEAATGAADALRVARLQGQERGAEALQFLEQLAQSEGTADAADLAIARTHVNNGDFATAETFIKARLEEDPDRPLMRMILAAVYIATDRVAQAEGVYRTLLDENDQREAVWRALYRAKMLQGDATAAQAVLDAALAAMPEAPDLLWAHAGVLEREGDVEGAIAVYESLYERLPNSPIVANNLASLLATYRTDDAALDRAHRVARRLRGMEVPAFQDTYGWIAYRRGDIEAAIAHLEPAAEGLPEDPMVQFHLGMAYAGAERHEAALTHLRRALDIAGPADTRPQFADARDEIGRLEAIVSENPEN